jgi:hypothetical protein
MDHDFPFHVALLPKALAEKISDADKFCSTVDYRIKRENDDFRWCFADPGLAKSFQEKFGGKLIVADVSLYVI